MTPSVLEARGIRTEFGDRRKPVQAVRGVSLRIDRGEKVGIVGESGSGKSALALSILGLIEPPGRVVGGEVLVHGSPVDLDDDRSLSRIRGKQLSLVYQDPMAALDPVKTIGDQIGEAIRRHQPRISRRAIRHRVIELLREVDVPDPHGRVDSYPHQYSGGMRQRVVIAIALANEPDLIIADEPTTALDVTTQAQVLDLLDRMAEDHGCAVVLITHNMGVVAEFCDRVLVMYAGRIVEEGPTEAVFARPAHPYTEAVLATVLHPDRLPSGRLPAIDGMPPPLDALPPGCSFAPRCPQRARICVEQLPPRLELPRAQRPGTAECHFALDRLEGASLAEDRP